MRKRGSHMPTNEQLKQREAYLTTFESVEGIPILLDRFQPESGFNYVWYGIPENRAGKRLRKFPVNPISLSSLERTVQILKTVWGDHVIGIITGGTRADRNARSGHSISPHSIRYGSQEAKVWCTGIDIDGIMWKDNDNVITIYCSNRSMAPKTFVIPTNYWIGDEFISNLGLNRVIEIVAGYNKPYVVMGCILSQCFGTVLHDNCSGYTGVTHRDHFHVDNVRKIGFVDSNSQATMVQMALNLEPGNTLKIDGKIGPKTIETWKSWAESVEVPWTHEAEMYRKLMEITPVRHGG